MAEKYVNHFYHCNVQWDDEWSCMCNDECPVCHHEIEPYASSSYVVHNANVERMANDEALCCVVCGDAECAEHQGLQRP
jgi:hypothetical protein